MTILHRLAHWLHLNACRAFSVIRDGEIYHWHECVTCGYKYEEWQFFRNAAQENKK